MIKNRQTNTQKYIPVTNGKGKINLTHVHLTDLYKIKSNYIAGTVRDSERNNVFLSELVQNLCPGSYFGTQVLPSEIEQKMALHYRILIFHTIVSLELMLISTYYAAI